MDRPKGQRRRVRDWWRWTAIVPVLGSVAPVVVAVRRRRWVWAGVITLATAAETALLIIGGARANDYTGNQTNLPAGVGFQLWLLVVVLGWVFPNTRTRRVRPPWPAVTDRARALTVRYGLIAYVGAFAGTVALSLLLLAAGVHLGVGAGVLMVDAVLLGSLVPLIRAGRLGRRDLGLRFTRPGASAGLAVLAFIAYLAISEVWALLVIHPSTSSQTLTRQLNISAHAGTLTVVVDVLAIAVCAPVCEEIFFRGLLFRSLRNRLALWPAALIAGGLFGLVHITSYPLNTIPIKMLFGALMCLLYERTGSLLPCIAVHAFVDGSVADAIFAHNVVIALIVGAVVLALVGGRVLVNSFQRTVPATRVPPGPAVDPGVPWPPHLRDG